MGVVNCFVFDCMIKYIFRIISDVHLKEMDGLILLSIKIEQRLRL